VENFHNHGCDSGLITLRRFEIPNNAFLEQKPPQRTKIIQQATTAIQS